MRIPIKSMPLISDSSSFCLCSSLISSIRSLIFLSRSFTCVRPEAIKKTLLDSCLSVLIAICSNSSTGAPINSYTIGIWESNFSLILSERFVIIPVLCTILSLWSSQCAFVLNWWIINSSIVVSSISFSFKS